jgi:hypothetical protein
VPEDRYRLPMDHYNPFRNETGLRRPQSSSSLVPRSPTALIHTTASPMGHRSNTRDLTKSKHYTAVVVFHHKSRLFQARLLKNICRLPVVHWFEYDSEKGNLIEEVYSLVAQEFRVAAADVKGAFSMLSATPFRAI